MQSYTITCCSTVDLPREQLAARGIPFQPLSYTVDGVTRKDDLGSSLPYSEFYAAMAAGADTSTSQANISEFIDFFTPMLSAGQDILHLSLSSGLSGSASSATNAAAICAERFPERRICVVDSLGASSGSGLLLDTLADMRDRGESLETVRDFAESGKLCLHHWFFSTDLTYFFRGGRISRASCIFGGLLNICPLMNMDHLGRLVPRNKIRGKKKVISEIVERMKTHAEGGLSYSGKCYVCHSAVPEDARAVADLVEAAFPNLAAPVQINDIGTTIGSHTGPGTVALFFWGDERTN